MAEKNASSTSSISKRRDFDSIYSSDQYAELLKSCPKISKCLASSNGKPKLFENILRITAIIIEVMIICSVPEFKANNAIRTIIKTFLDYDTKDNEYSDKNPRRHIRKLEIISSLEDECHMNKTESVLAYYIVKFAFYAFYYRQSLTYYNEHLFSEIHWREASRRTVEAFAKYKNLSLTEISSVSQEVNWIYAKYIERKKNECKDYELKKQLNTKHAELNKSISKKSKLKIDTKSGKNLLHELRKCQEKIKVLAEERVNWEKEMEQSRQKLTVMENEAENWLLTIAAERMQQENCDTPNQPDQQTIEPVNDFGSWSDLNNQKTFESSELSMCRNSKQIDFYDYSKEFSINFNVTDSGKKLEFEINGLDMKDKLCDVNKLNIKNNQDVVMEFNCSPSNNCAM